MTYLTKLDSVPYIYNGEILLRNLYLVPKHYKDEFCISLKKKIINHPGNKAPFCSSVGCYFSGSNVCKNTGIEPKDCIEFNKNEGIFTTYTTYTRLGDFNISLYLSRKLIQYV